MKIVGWTNWHYEHEANVKYKRFDPETWEEVEKIEQIIAEELREKGYKFTGDYHQNGDYGVPVFDCGKVYQCSQRDWGNIMAMTYPEEIDNSDGFGYCKWAWVAPEQMKVPDPGDYVKD